MSVTVTNQRRPRPGFEPRRLADLCTAAVVRCHLDLAGRTVVTEAATGAYATTPVLAAVAGGTVRIVAANSAYGSAADAVDEVLSLARLLGVSDRITLVDRHARDVFRDADVVTNSGHLRPIDEHAVAQLRPGSAVTLMYEAWELRKEDVDINACSARGVYVAGINEQHPAVDV